MRILFIPHIGNSLTVRGGLEVLVNYYTKLLRQRGHEIGLKLGELADKPNIIVIVGSFYGLEDVLNAVKMFPIAVMPVLLYADRDSKFPFRQFNLLRSMWPYSLLNSRRKIISSADIVLGNTNWENNEAKLYGAKRVEVIRLGIDFDYYSCPTSSDVYFPAVFQESINRINSLKPDFICVARFETRKRQIEVAEACRKIGKTVIFIGRRSPVELNYIEQLIHTHNKHAIVLEDVPKEIIKYCLYKSKVHVLASQHETVGLVNIEAAACGCRPCVIDQPTAREYLSDAAVYSRSSSPVILKEALLESLERGRLNQEEILQLKNNLSNDKIGERLETLLVNTVNTFRSGRV